MALSDKNKRNRQAGTLIALFVAADLITKRAIFFYNIDTALITPVLNLWGARSLNIDPALIVALTIVICLWFIYLYSKKLLNFLPFVLLFAGALGNLYDRVALQAVRDRIDIGTFPVFNLADVCLTLGVLFLAFHYKKQSRTHKL